MTELLDNEIEEISIIKQTAMNDSSNSFISKDQFFTKESQNPKTSHKQIKELKRNTKRCKEHNELNGIASAHKKTFSTKLPSTELYACRFISKMKFISPMSPTKKEPMTPMKETITKQQYTALNRKDLPVKIGQICTGIQSKASTALGLIQQEFVNELDVLYSDNLYSIQKVNDKFNYDLYKSQSDTNNTSSSNEKYNQVLSEKNSELSEAENEFLIKKNCLLLKYNTKLISIRKDIAKHLNDEREAIKDETIEMLNKAANPTKRVIVRTKQLSVCCSAKKGIVTSQKAWKL